MKKVLMIILVAVTTGYGVVKAQQPAVMLSDKSGWHKIGETTVDFSKEMDEIVVMGADRFASVKFKVTDAPIELVSMDIYFEDGDKQSVKVGLQIKAPGESKVIDLAKGSERNLKKVVYTYKTLPNHKNEKAHVELWGLKTNTDKK